MEKVSLKVNTMNCDHCAQVIKDALEGLEGIEKIDISLEEKIVIVEYDNSKIIIDKIKEAIDEEGYEVE